LISNPLTRVRVKIERAKEHIRNLEQEIIAFQETNPYDFILERDPESGDRIAIAQIPELPPLRFGAITGDAIHNLRSAHDVLWRGAWSPGGSPYSRSVRDFPIADNADRFEANLPRVIKPRRKAIVDLVKATHPYKGGNDTLWLLHQLNNIDKHRTVIPAIALTDQVLFETRDPVTGVWYPDLRIRDQPLYPVEDGTVLLRIPAAAWSEVDMKPYFRFTVAFGEAEIVQGKPIVATLHQIARTVDGVCDTFVSARLV
jgi:hypothetical protein